MKNILLFLLVLLSVNMAFGQRLLKRSRKLSPYVTEKYSYTIGTDREIKQGLYQALYNKKFALASGKYVDDKRVGLWHFFNRRGEVIENYNYDTKSLQAETAEDSTSSLHYVFDTPFTNTDKVTKPIKIGGRYFGYIPYLNSFKLPTDINYEDIKAYIVIVELLISPGGRLADLNIHLNSPWEDDRVINININRFSEEDKVFIPATLNNNPISSRILIECRITPQEVIDIL